MTYRQYIIKRKIEAVFIYPFIWLGRQIAKKRPLDKAYDVFFFFPFYHIGGADKVHYQIAKATGGNNCIIFAFTAHDGYAKCSDVLYSWSAPM